MEMHYESSQPESTMFVAVGAGGGVLAAPQRAPGAPLPPRHSAPPPAPQRLSAAPRLGGASREEGRTMPTITSIQLLRHRGNAEPVGLGAAHDVRSFGYFERKVRRAAAQAGVGNGGREERPAALALPRARPKRTGC